MTRIVVFGADRRVGVWRDDVVVDVAAADAARTHGRASASEPLPAELDRFIAGGRRVLDAAMLAVEHALDTHEPGHGIVHERAHVTLHAPAVVRPRIACAANNFALHTMGSVAGREPAHAATPSAALAAAGIAPHDSVSAEQIVSTTRERAAIRGFWKDFALPTGPDDDVPYPAGTDMFDYEGELAVVMGPAARGVPAARALEHVWGVTLHNDLSIRTPHGTPRSSFNLTKNFDRAASVGPAILVGELDPQDFDVETRVNGEVRQRYNTRDMIFSFAEFVEHLSRNLTLQPGDMISGGSGAGSAVDASRLVPGGTVWPDDLDRAWFLTPGDVVEVSSPRIGVLRNRIVPAST